VIHAPAWVAYVAGGPTSGLFRDGAV